MGSAHPTVISVIAAETQGDVRILTLDRPERRNAMVPELMAALADRVRRCAREAGPRGLVLTGSGSAFCVGADLKWLAAQSEPGEAVGTLVAAHHAAVRALLEAPLPVVAALNGPAAGGGLSLALAADYRIATPTASFTAAYFRLGLPPDGGSSAFLVRSIGAARAMELLLTNRTLSADEALAWGLVSEVVPADALLERAAQAASGFSAVPAETLLRTRRLLETALSQPIEAQLDAEKAAMRAAAASPSFRESLDAFVRRSGRP